MQPDGKFVIAGYASFTSNGTDMIAVRYSADGTATDSESALRPVGRPPKRKRVNPGPGGNKSGF